MKKPEHMKKLDAIEILLSEISACITYDALKEKLARVIGLKGSAIIKADQLHVRIYEKEYNPKDDGNINKLVLFYYLVVDKQDAMLESIPLFNKLHINKGLTSDFFTRTKKHKLNPLELNVQRYDDICKHTLFQELVDEIKDKSKEDQEHITKIMRSFDKMLIAPLILEGKAFGTLAILRKKKKTQKANPFSDVDMYSLRRIADNVAVAVRNQWIFENKDGIATSKAEGVETSQVSDDGSSEPKSVERNYEKLSKDMILAAKKRTLADDGKIRFLDWKREMLVPGAVEHPSADPTNHDQSNNKELFCSLRKVNICPAGVAASKGQPGLYPELQGSPHYKELVRDVLMKLILFSSEYEYLSAWDKSLETLPDKSLKDFTDDEIERLKKVEIKRIKKKYYPKMTGIEGITLNEKSIDKIRDEPLSSDAISVLLSEIIESLKKRRRSLSLEHESNSIKENISAQRAHVLKKLQAMLNYVPKIYEWQSEIVAPLTFDNSLIDNASASKCGTTGNNIIGVINVHSKSPRYFTNSDLLVLQSFAAQMSQKVLLQQRRDIERIQSIARDMAAKGSFASLVERTIEGIREAAFFTPSAKIYPIIYRCKKPSFPDELLIDRSELKENQFDDLPLESGYIKEIPVETYNALAKVPISQRGLGFQVICDLRNRTDDINATDVFKVLQYAEDPAQGASKVAVRLGVKTIACLPLTFKKNVYGLLYIHVTENHYFTEFEKNSLMYFANQVAIVLKNIERDGKPYREEYGDGLLRKCIAQSSKTDGAGADTSLLKRVLAILRENETRLCESYRSDAIAYVKDIVKKIVEGAKLPEYVWQTYIDFIEQEDLLYYSPTYRDHFFHPFHTFMLGLLILKSQPTFFKSAGDKQADQFLTQWIIASFWHDTSYASAKGPEWLREFIHNNVGVYINTSQDWSPMMHRVKIIDAIDRLSELFAKKKYETKTEQNITEQNKSKFDFKRWLCKQLLEHKDHGVLSAILLLITSADSKDGQLNEESKRNLEESALAIALHNYHKSYTAEMKESERLKKTGISLGKVADDLPSQQIGKIEIGRFQLAFFLAFCDTAQEWGRPKRSGYSDKVVYSFEDVAEMPDDEKDARKGLEIIISAKIGKGESEDAVKPKQDLLDSWTSEAFRFNILQKTETIR